MITERDRQRKKKNSSGQKSEAGFPGRFSHPTKNASFTGRDGKFSAGRVMVRKGEARDANKGRTNAYLNRSPNWTGRHLGNRRSGSPYPGFKNTKIK